MFKPLALGLLLISTSGCLGIPWPSDQEQLTFCLGNRRLGDSQWASVDDQVTIGVEFVVSHSESIFAREIGVAFSYAEEPFNGSLPGFGSITTDVVGRTLELHVGLRISDASSQDTFRPYAGVGIAAIRADMRANGRRYSDESGAFYAHAGVNAHVSESLFIGVDVRTLFASDLLIAGSEGDADYLQASITMGVDF